jgi:uncharacterized ion transporter superfamily protein YfcC
VEVRQEKVRRNYRTVVQYFDLMENGSTPETIGPAEEILNMHVDRVPRCTGLIIGKHGIFCRHSITFATSLLNPSRVGIATTTASLLNIHRECSNVRSTAVGD